MSSQFARGWNLAAAGLLLLSACGCSGAPDDAPAAFAKPESVTKLPESYQNQLNKILIWHFGRIDEPRLLVPVKGPNLKQGVKLDGPAPPYETKVRTSADRLAQGMAVYQRHCATCHGYTGDGNGEAAQYLNPKPRDYRQGVFKFTSTENGEKPTRDDLALIIRRGAKGTSMPAFPFLSEGDLDALVEYVVYLAYRGQSELRIASEAEFYAQDEYPLDAAVAEQIVRIDQAWEDAPGKIVVPAVPQPPFSDETVAKGARVFKERVCSKCHGDSGQGHLTGKRGTDVWGEPVVAADLTMGMLRGGRRPIDIYRRIYAGVNGGRMPAQGAYFKDDPVQIWYLAHFIIAVTEGRPVSGLTDTAAPADDDDDSPSAES